MLDRRLRRSDVIARENREKRVTRISRQRLRGLIEEAVEHVINEAYNYDNADIYTINRAIDKMNQEVRIPRDVVKKTIQILSKAGLEYYTDCIIDDVVPEYDDDGEIIAFWKGFIIRDTVSPNESHAMIYSAMVEEDLRKLGFHKLPGYGNDGSGLYDWESAYWYVPFGYRGTRIDKDDLLYEYGKKI